MANSSRLEGDLKPQARRVLEMLRSAGDRGVSNGDFVSAYMARFGGRICEMRKLGWSIETVREGQGRSRYFLRAEPTGIDAGAHTPVSASVDSGGTDPARSMDDDSAAGISHPGGGALFDANQFAGRRGYADSEEIAAA
ncbi:MAG TPA: hypothetical protein VGC63_04825 [Solirubrobacterales bacterium]